MPDPSRPGQKRFASIVFFSLANELQQLRSQKYLDTGPLAREKYILLPDKLIFSLLSWRDKFNFWIKQYLLK